MYSVKHIGKVMQCMPPQAYARIMGSGQYPCVTGYVYFYNLCDGVLVVASVDGLPKRESVLGFHIHEGGKCSGNSNDPFADTGSHYNPGDCQHPYHAGDLPPLFVNNGSAFCAVATSRFRICDIIDRTVVVHKMADDFMTQPSGNSGAKIACGVICRA